MSKKVIDKGSGKGKADGNSGLHKKVSKIPKKK